MSERVASKHERIQFEMKIKEDATRKKTATREHSEINTWNNKDIPNTQVERTNNHTKGNKRNLIWEKKKIKKLQGDCDTPNNGRTPSVQGNLKLNYENDHQGIGSRSSNVGKFATTTPDMNQGKMNNLDTRKTKMQLESNNHGGVSTPHEEYLNHRDTNYYPNQISRETDMNNYYNNNKYNNTYNNHTNYKDMSNSSNQRLNVNNYQMQIRGNIDSNHINPNMGDRNMCNNNSKPVSNPYTPYSNYQQNHPRVNGTPYQIGDHMQMQGNFDYPQYNSQMKADPRPIQYSQSSKPGLIQTPISQAPSSYNNNHRNYQPYNNNPPVVTPNPNQSGYNKPFGNISFRNTQPNYMNEDRMYSAPIRDNRKFIYPRSSNGM